MRQLCGHAGKIPALTVLFTSALERDGQIAHTTLMTNSRRAASHPKRTVKFESISMSLRRRTIVELLFARPSDQTTSIVAATSSSLRSATCAAITIDNTFIASRCCGLEECADAGAPGKRDTSRVSASSSGILMLHDLDGNVIEPKSAALLQHADDEPSLPVHVRSAETQPTKFLTERDCDCFQATRGPFQSGGTNYVISDVVTCTPTESCQATLGEEVTEETTFSTEVPVSDPLGIVSASVGFEFSESVTQSFEGSYTFGPGERRYVVFIPWITCVEGYFTGDCSDEGVQTTICGGESSGGAIKGEQRPVIIRG
ncbi:hypothetical protein AG0111_0g5574 [Alternaria gaisen]|uniref:Uncharacterized protein n=1 Tax=Alternaria gaisen TaxID=167740 RepID=A0ACB6FPG3_9PLEO|nr:hypothetical protein AG0111_0g5574 [Alternaria gaisen]